MNSDLESLLAALREIMGRDITPGDMRQAPGNLMGGGTRALTEAERRARGIDPRDPNQYFVTPDGNVGGTLMGWAGMGDKLTPEQTEQMWNSRPSMPQASANQGGRYRLSPGVYGTREQAMRKYQDDMRNWNPSGEATGDMIGQLVAGDGGVTPMTPMIPRAAPNRFGMTRMSPGMYKNKDGKVVRSASGAPAKRGSKRTARVEG